MNKRRRLKRERNKADKLWREKVKERFAGKCVVCGATQYVQCHHLLPRELAEWRVELENGILLCASHHKYSRLLSAHKNPVAFAVWMMDNRLEQWQWAAELVRIRLCGRSSSKNGLQG